jgi:DNA-binding GntR family transcriptional regulator
VNAVSGQQLRRQQLRDEVLRYIRELIISGQVQAGEPLRLATLARDSEVSITPVREALLLLSQEGWVEQKPNRGFWVAPIHREDVEDAYLVHAFASGELAARAATKVTEDDVEELRRLDAQVAAVSAAPDPSGGDGLEGAPDQLNFELHKRIYAVADSPRLSWFIEAATRFVPRRFWVYVPGWIEHNRDGHRPIVDALEAHDAETAREAMISHIAGAGELHLAHLDALGLLVRREDEKKGEAG